MRRIVALGFVIASSLATTPASAQFDLGGMVRNGAQGAANAAANAAAERALASAIDEKAPIVTPDSLVYPTVARLPGGPFRIHVALLDKVGRPVVIDDRNRAALGRLLHASDGSVHLAPGDYTFPMSVYCMKASAHSPSGHHYTLAKLQGSVARAIERMNVLAARNPEIKHGQIQGISWALQSGESFAELPPDYQATLSRLDPNFANLVPTDYLQTVRDTWNTASRVMPNAPTYDSALAKLGPLGSQLETLRESRGRIAQYHADFGALGRYLVPAASPASAQTGDTPWSHLARGVYARYVTTQGYSGTGNYEVRVFDRHARARRAKLHCPPKSQQKYAPCPALSIAGVTGSQSGGGNAMGGDAGGEDDVDDGDGDDSPNGDSNGGGNATDENGSGDNGSNASGNGGSGSGSGSAGDTSAGGAPFGGDDGGADVPIGDTVAAPGDDGVQPLSFGPLGWGAGGPDFATVSASAPLGDLPVGINVGFTVDKYGGTYASVGLGFPPGWGGGVSAGMVSGLGDASHAGIANAIGGWGGGFSVQPGGAGGLTGNPSWSLPSGQGVHSIGASTPGSFGANIGYTFDITSIGQK